MSNLDFLVFTLILLFIAFYGVYKNYQNKNLKSYILGDRSLSWSTIGLSVMATQASAITFISTPGQGYAEGMSFIQNYFGMPLALIVVSIFFIPRYYGSKVFTAYQYLEKRFDLKVRTLTSFFSTTERISKRSNNICSFYYFNCCIRLGTTTNSYFCRNISYSIYSYWWKQSSKLHSKIPNVCNSNWLSCFLLLFKLLHF